MAKRDSKIFLSLTRVRPDWYEFRALGLRGTVQHRSNGRWYAQVTGAPLTQRTARDARSAALLSINVARHSGVT